MSGGSAKREIETGEKATSHGKAPSRESGTKAKEGSPPRVKLHLSGDKKKKMKKVLGSTTRPTLCRPPHLDRTRRPSLLSAMSGRSIVRCHFDIPVFLSALLYSQFH
jgi:hypothetical protein